MIDSLLETQYRSHHNHHFRYRLSSSSSASSMWIGMASKTGIAGCFLNSLAKAGVNVRAIAQGSSERQISVVVRSEDCTRALRAVHSGFTLSDTEVTVGLIGHNGLVGRELVKQMTSSRDTNRDKFGLDFRLAATAGSSKMVLADMPDSEQEWEAMSVPTCLDAFTDHMLAAGEHRVVIDCTSSEQVSDYYAKWLAAGVHVITPNKKVGSGPLSRYQECQEAQTKGRSQWYYECTVGAALPLVGTIQHLMETGDSVKRIEGVLSGTLSYLFNTLTPDTPFSEVLASAKEQGFTEPDPRDDLSGLDMARKVVILAREVGLEVELDDVHVESLVPEPLQSWEPTGRDGLSASDEFIQEMKAYDSELMAKVQAAAADGGVLRYVGVVDMDQGTASVEVKTLPTDHLLARLQYCDNAVSVASDRYQPQPLVVQGPGAGAAITASGVYADFLQLGKTLLDFT